MVQVDPNLAAKSMGKIEDDVPALYKRLRYPFGISKSALFAVGSPHTWPGLLAALTWLVELLNYEEKAVRRSAALHSMPSLLLLNTLEPFSCLLSFALLCECSMLNARRLVLKQAERILNKQ